MNLSEEPIWLDKSTVIGLHMHHIQQFVGAEGSTENSAN